MHIKSVQIRNIKAFQRVTWELPSDTLPGWHVIIGDNGTGKSTFLRAIAAALTGPRDIQALREDWSSWMRDGGASEVTVDVNPSKDWDEWSGTGRQLKNFYPRCGIMFQKSDVGEPLVSPSDEVVKKADRHVWSRRRGWFSASYGPFRRFSGGEPEQRKLFYSHPFLARHLSVFGENVALTEALEWLGQLRFEQLEQNSSSSDLLSKIMQFVNQPNFLPHGVTFQSVNSKAVVFSNAEGISLDVARLSDGYRSVLSMTFELIRQLASSFGSDGLFAGEGSDVFLTPPGVVMIDEIDAHLHPTWQRRIGGWLTKHFPNIQFIVTTHSPLVCQAAERGTIFRLPLPGVSSERAGFVKGIDRERLIMGDVLDAYGTKLFGDDIDRSDAAQELMAQLAQFNQRVANGQSLSRGETRERNRLRQIFAGHGMF